MGGQGNIRPHTMSAAAWCESITVNGADGQVAWESLAEMGKAIRPGGKLTVVAAQPGSLGMNLMVAGFVDVQTTPTESGVQVTASKAGYQAGASAKLKSAKLKPAANSVWTVQGDENEDLMDEDDLLTQDEINAKPVLPECGPKSEGKKACKNCSCGYAEELDKAVESGEVPVKSACGSCYKGDAFRCATCPYRGMPAFEPGEKVQLTLEDDI